MREELLRDKSEQVKELGAAIKNMAIWLHRLEYGHIPVEEWTIFADINGSRVQVYSKDWNTALEKLRAYVPCDAATAEVLLSL